MFWLPGAILSEKRCLGLFTLFQPAALAGQIGGLGRAAKITLRRKSPRRKAIKSQVVPCRAVGGCSPLALYIVAELQHQCPPSWPCSPPKSSSASFPQTLPAPWRAPCSKETKFKTIQAPVKAWPLRKKKLPSKLFITRNSSNLFQPFLALHFPALNSDFGATNFSSCPRSGHQILCFRVSVWWNCYQISNHWSFLENSSVPRDPSGDVPSAWELVGSEGLEDAKATKLWVLGSDVRITRSFHSAQLPSTCLSTDISG